MKFEDEATTKIRGAVPVLFSFIVPIYNSEKYLRQCLSSIIQQSIGNWEAVLIDDGSTDSSGAIADEFASKDPRIRVVHQKNQGTSGATNTALSLVQGEYVVNVDNDDFVAHTLLEKAAILIKEFNPDVIQFPPVFLSPEGDEIERYGLIKERYVATTNEEMRSFLSVMGDGYLRSHSQKIIKRSKIGNIRFKGVSKGADLSFMRRVLFRCERGILEPEFLYFVRIRSDSETHRPNPPLLYKEWFSREIEDLQDCIAANREAQHGLPFWEFDNLFDLAKLFSAKAILDHAYDGRFFRDIFAIIDKNRRYVLKKGFRVKLSFYAWKHFTKPLASNLSKRGIVDGQIF